MGEAIIGSANGNCVHRICGFGETDNRSGCWYEEEIEDDLRWCFQLNSILRTSVSNYQDIALLDTKPFGKEVVDFCRKYLMVNREAFCSVRLELVINDARAELESREEQFDVIVGDLADPVEGGPCYQLYTKSFYERVMKPKLSDRGMFVTQAGPAGVLTHTEVFSSIYNTLKQVFKYVMPYSAHVPSYADTWGWVMASDHHPFTLDAPELDTRINQRIKGELRYLDGDTFIAAATFNKSVRKSLARESHVYTEETARFVHGHGKASAI